MQVNYQPDAIKDMEFKKNRVFYLRIFILENCYLHNCLCLHYYTITNIIINYTTQCSIVSNSKHLVVEQDGQFLPVLVIPPIIGSLQAVLATQPRFLGVTAGSYCNRYLKILPLHILSVLHTPVNLLPFKMITLRRKYRAKNLSHSFARKKKQKKGLQSKKSKMIHSVDNIEKYRTIHYKTVLL